MPIYEYQCHQCGQITEALQKFSDLPLSECPQCGGKISKLISMNSFQLKGGGWYATDYAKPPKESKAKPVTDTGSKSGESKTSTPAEATKPTTTEKPTAPKEA